MFSSIVITLKSESLRLFFSWIRLVHIKCTRSNTLVIISTGHFFSCDLSATISCLVVGTLGARFTEFSTRIVSASFTENIRTIRSTKLILLSLSP